MSQNKTITTKIFPDLFRSCIIEKSSSEGEIQSFVYPINEVDDGETKF